MALKDWNKIFDQNNILIFEKENKNLLIGYEVYSDKWRVEYNNKIIVLKTTKSQAIKFAKSYMRKH